MSLKSDKRSPYYILGNCKNTFSLLCEYGCEFKDCFCEHISIRTFHKERVPKYIIESFYLQNEFLCDESSDCMSEIWYHSLKMSI